MADVVAFLKDTQAELEEWFPCGEISDYSP